MLRRAPFGANIKTAHDMGREFRILSGLQGALPAGAAPIAFCDDEAVIGAQFYLMERVQGVIIRNDAPPPGVDLHAGADPRHLRPRSSTTWRTCTPSTSRRRRWPRSGSRRATSRARSAAGASATPKAKTDDAPGAGAAAAWLARNMPPERGAALIHNDYKYDNVVLDPAQARRTSLAVLDWEMATIGDPLMDLGTMLGLLGRSRRSGGHADPLLRSDRAPRAASRASGSSSATPRGPGATSGTACSTTCSRSSRSPSSGSRSTSATWTVTPRIRASRR